MKICADDVHGGGDRAVKRSQIGAGSIIPQHYRSAPVSRIRLPGPAQPKISLVPGRALSGRRRTAVGVASRPALVHSTDPGRVGPKSKPLCDEWLAADEIRASSRQHSVQRPCCTEASPDGTWAQCPNPLCYLSDTDIVRAAERQLAAGGIDTDVQLPPGSTAGRAVLFNQPFAYSAELQAGAVHQQMQRAGARISGGAAPPASSPAGSAWSGPAPRDQV